MNNDLTTALDRKQLVVGAFAFSFPLLVLITDIGTGLLSFAFLIGAFVFARDARAAFVRHLPETRWVAIAFLLNFLFALACFVLRPESPLSTLEEPSRMLFALSAMLLVQVARPPSAMLWRGVIGGALAGAAFVGYQRWVMGLDRPGGLINAITFGDISLCLGLLALASATNVRSVRDALWPVTGALAGLAGAIATGTRGSWLALVLFAILLVRHRQRIRSKLVRLLAALVIGLLVAGYFVPQTGMRGRIADARANIDEYFSDGFAFTNVGIRLELWKGAAMLIAERPLLGQDIGVARERMKVMVAEGRLDPVALPPTHFHNDILQNLVSGGVAGLLVWAGTLLAPFMFFARMFSAQQCAGRERMGLALGGMLLVSSYFAFGLTEVIFWSVRSTMFYAIMVFLFMGFCLNAKDDEERALRSKTHT